uniref:TTC3/DZIP3-like helical domain-containing protein n=1 Tax=Plectus sambesii TaxID=2011161 RepID=A0A914V374_9BILA
MSVITARAPSEDAHVAAVVDSDESEVDDLNSDYETFMQEISDIVAELGSSNDDYDELDQYVDQLVNEEEETHLGERSIQRADASIASRLLPSTQTRDSAFVANGAQKIGGASDEQQRTTADHMGLPDALSMADCLALVEECRIRADDEQRLRMQLEHNFLQEKAQREEYIDQLHAENGMLDDRVIQFEEELKSTQAERSLYEQQVRCQTKEIEGLSAEKSWLTRKLQEMQQNTVPLSKAKHLSSENKRLNVEYEKMKQRAVEAEVGIYMLKQRYETDGLKRSLNDVQKTLETLRKIIHDISAMAYTDAEKADVREFLSAEQQWMDIEEEISRVLRQATTDFDRYIAMIRGGTPLAHLPPIRIPNRPQPPLTPNCPDWIVERRSKPQHPTEQPTSSSQSSTVTLLPPPGLEFACSPTHIHQPAVAAAATIAPTGNDITASLHTAPTGTVDAGSYSQQPAKPRTQALFDGVAALVLNTSRSEIAEAIQKAREGLPQGFRALGLVGAIQRVAETVKEERRLREMETVDARLADFPLPTRRTFTQPQPVRLINGHPPSTAAEIASATVAPRKESKELPSSTAVETAAEKVSFFDAPKDDDCTICHEPFRKQVDLERCRVCHTVFHHGVSGRPALGL